MNILKVICFLALVLSLVQGKKSRRRMQGRNKMGKEPSRKAEAGEICYYGGPSAEFEEEDEWWACVVGTTCIKVSYKSSTDYESHR